MVAGAIVLAAPAHATTDNENQFIRDVTADTTIPVVDSNTRPLIGLGHAVCHSLNQGHDRTSIAGVIYADADRNGLSMTLSDAQAIVNDAVKDLC